MIVPPFLGPPWPARPGHLHSFVHRLTKEASPWCNPFNEIASIPSSLIQRRLFASDHRQTFHIHRSSVRLRPAIRLCGHSFLRKPVQGSELISYLISDALCVVTYMVYHPMTPISACNRGNSCLWIAVSQQVGGQFRLGRCFSPRTRNALEECHTAACRRN